jgi:hypothetical protein
MAEYERDMLKKSTIADIRSKISDTHTLNVSAYDPSGLESLDTYVGALKVLSRTLHKLIIYQTRNFPHRNSRPYWHGNLSHYYYQHSVRKPGTCPRDWYHYEQ